MVANNPQFSLSHPDLSPEMLEESHLVVQYSPRHLRLAASHPVHGLVLGQEFAHHLLPENPQGHLHSVLEGHSVFNNQVKPARITILVQTGVFVLVPNLWFNPSLGNLYFNLNTMPTAGLQPCHAAVNGDITAVFALPQAEANFIVNYFQGLPVAYTHASLPQIQLSASHVATPGFMQVLIEDRWALVTASRSGQLLLSVAVTFSVAEELVEYLRSAWSELNLDSNGDELQLQGQVIRSSDIYRRIYPFFNNITFAFSALPENSVIGQDLEPQRYFDLFSVAKLPASVITGESAWQGGQIAQ